MWFGMGEKGESVCRQKSDFGGRGGGTGGDGGLGDGVKVFNIQGFCLTYSSKK